MDLIKIATGKDGKTHYINPEHVIRVEGNKNETVIFMTQFSEADGRISQRLIVGMDVDEVAKLLNGEKAIEAVEKTAERTSAYLPVDRKNQIDEGAVKILSFLSNKPEMKEEILKAGKIPADFTVTTPKPSDLSDGPRALDGLITADTNKDGKLDFTEVREWVKKAVGDDGVITNEKAQSALSGIPLKPIKKTTEKVPSK